MKFWDTSSLLLLILEEEQSSAVRKIAKEDGSLVVWWGTFLECRSSFSRLKRENKISSMQEDVIIELLEQLSSSWVEIMASENIRKTAIPKRGFRVQDITI